MVSIIAAIHNQLGMNKLFLKYLQEYTFFPYELIIIDNCSTDGSAEFFEANGAVVIRNAQNFSYPYCQNQGIRVAKYNVLAFLNNDLIVSKHWDKRMIEIAEHNNLEIWALSSIDRLETPELTRKMRNRWKAVKNPLYFLFGAGYGNLALMLKLMFGNWERYTENRYNTFKTSTFEGVTGSAIILKKDVLDKIGLWDERIQAADFDLYFRAKERCINVGDMRPPAILSGVFCHHYTRLSFKASYPPFADKANLISIADKWGLDYARSLTKDAFMRV